MAIDSVSTGGIEKESENTVRLNIWQKLCSLPHIRLFRNNVGLFFHGKSISEGPGYLTLQHPRRIRCGLHTGSADLIGWKTVTITPDMLGKKVAVFASVETKRAKGKAREEQVNWARQVTLAGGIACIVDSVDAALQQVGE